MTADMPDNGDQVQRIADRLADIATIVADEADALTGTMRAVGDHARDIAALAAELGEAAHRIEANVQAQTRLLERARTSATDNAPMMAALAGSVRTVAQISTLISDIAGRSRQLGLNARIEAARTGDAGNGFAAVARAMTDLAVQTREATHDIGARTDAISGHVEAACAMIEHGMEIVRLEEQMIGGIADTTERQRSTAEHVVTLTSETVTRMDDAAASIGRVASAASVVRLLARQITRVAERTPAAA